MLFYFLGHTKWKRILCSCSVPLCARERVLSSLSLRDLIQEENVRCVWIELKEWFDFISFSFPISPTAFFDWTRIWNNFFFFLSSKQQFPTDKILLQLPPIPALKRVFYSQIIFLRGSRYFFEWSSSLNEEQKTKIVNSLVKNKTKIW